MVLALKGQVLENQQILPEFYRMEISVPPLAAKAAPGQFVMVKTSATLEPFLKRPISINGFDKEIGTITLVYQVIGRGTALLAQLKKGEDIELVGPLGNGFAWSEEDKSVVLVGGGCGVAPLIALGEELVKAGKQVYALIGAQSKEKLLGEEEFTQMGIKLMIATDDGSYGRKGFVTELLSELLRSERLDKIFCCGPRPMTKSVVALAKEFHIPSQVSLEERMGCGVGLCIGCVCKVSNQDGTVTYKKVCQDGPVFDGSEVIFDD